MRGTQCVACGIAPARCSACECGRGGAGARPARPAEARVGHSVDADPRLGSAIVKWLLSVPDDLRQKVEGKCVDNFGLNGSVEQVYFGQILKHR